MKANGHVFKYGDNVDTDVIIPARYLNSSDPKELALHCMEDIDTGFVKMSIRAILLLQIKILAAVPPGSMHRLQSKRPASAVSLPRHLRVFFTAMPLISGFRLLNARKQPKAFLPGMK